MKKVTAKAVAARAGVSVSAVSLAYRGNAPIAEEKRKARAADYAGRSLKEHLSAARSEVALICQIEDPDGVVNYSEIADVDGVDALFIGRADLAVSHGLSDFFAPEVAKMTRDILSATWAATGLYCAPTEPLDAHRDAEGSFFVVGSEHTLMQLGGAALVEDFKKRDAR